MSPIWMGLSYYWPALRIQSYWSWLDTAASTTPAFPALPCSLFLKFRKPIAKLVSRSTLCCERKKVTDRWKPVSFDAFFIITLEKRGSGMLGEITLFQQPVNGMQIVTFDASDKRLLWKKRNEDCFHRAARQAKNFLSLVTANLALQSSGLFHNYPSLWLQANSAIGNHRDRRTEAARPQTVFFPPSPSKELLPLQQVRAVQELSTPALPNRSHPFPVEVYTCITTQVR